MTSSSPNMLKFVWFFYNGFWVLFDYCLVAWFVHVSFFSSYLEENHFLEIFKTAEGMQFLMKVLKWNKTILKFLPWVIFWKKSACFC